MIAWTKSPLVAVIFLAACGGAPTEGPADPAGGKDKAPDAAPATEAAAFDQKAFEEATLSSIDPSANVCEDFYQYACGGWMKSTELPGDKATFTRSFSVIYDQNQAMLREMLEKPAADPASQKVGEYYAACMDTDAQEARGLTPVAPMFAIADSIKDGASLATAAGQLQLMGVDILFTGAISPDAKRPDINVLQLMQGGLSLPDREYYLSDKPESKELLKSFEAHVAKMFEISGVAADQAAKDAAAIVAFETEIAKGHWEVAKLRDANATDNPKDVAGLKGTAPAFDWDAFFAASNISPETLNDISPSALTATVELASKTDPATLALYARWMILHTQAGYLTKALDEESFAFFGKTLSGQKEQQPQWKRCVGRAEAAMGELLGEAYVAKAFPGESKKVAVDMIKGIETSFEAGLADLKWMDETTRGRAVEKARAIKNKIGYPDKPRDYSALAVGKDAFANHLAATQFEVAYQLGKIDKPVDPGEWHMTAQMVNAYYNPPGNEIAFPAGILQPPFFHKDFPKAFNYGAIGMVMGHEITHGFDDEGRKYTPDGRLEDWWDPSVVAKFEEAASCVTEQYSKYEVQPGVFVNGDLTLGENIADMGGLKQSYHAYQEWKKANGEEPKIGELTGDQQFFLSFAQGWCTIATPELEKVRAATDPHSPPRFRINGPLRDFPAFGEAFGCEVGSPMRPADVCEVW